MAHIRNFVLLSSYGILSCSTSILFSVIEIHSAPKDHSAPEVHSAPKDHSTLEVHLAPKDHSAPEVHSASSWEFV